MLDESRHASEWMPEIEQTWVGQFLQLFIKNNEKLFFRQFQMTQYELEDLVDDFYNYSLNYLPQIFTITTFTVFFS